MPKGRVGGDSGAGISTPSPGTFSATASTTSSTAFGLTKPGFLTELSIRVDGDPMAGAITGGPVKIEAWLGRGSFYRHLCSGAIQNEMTVKGSGMLPVSAGDRIVVKWTELSGTAVTVRVDAFVDEETKGENAVGWLDETPRTLYCYNGRRINTQTGAGGGALQTNVQVATGSMASLLSYYVTLSTNSTLFVRLRDEDSADLGKLGQIGAAANNIVSLPTTGTAASGTDNAITTEAFRLTPGNMIAGYGGAASAQNDTLTVGISLLLTEPIEPTWTTTGSGGTPSLADSTISAANTWQIVRCPL